MVDNRGIGLTEKQNSRWLRKPIVAGYLRAFGCGCYKAWREVAMTKTIDVSIRAQMQRRLLRTP
jgi:hypothetical protein